MSPRPPRPDKPYVRIGLIVVLALGLSLQPSLARCATCGSASQDVSFDAWLSGFVDEARARGYSDEVLEKTVVGLFAAYAVVYASLLVVTSVRRDPRLGAPAARGRLPAMPLVFALEHLSANPYFLELRQTYC